MHRHLLVLALASLTAVSSSAPATSLHAETGPAAGAGENSASVINFSLLDSRGRHVELRRTDARAVVLYFTSYGCPIARQSMGKLRRLEEAYRERGVQVWLINAMPGADPDPKFMKNLALMAARGRIPGMSPTSKSETASQVRTLGALSEILPEQAALGNPDEFYSMALRSNLGSLTLLRDEHQLVTRYFGVRRTCEAIVIDPKAMQIVYRGALDDQMVPGAQKPAPTVNYLTDALDQFLEGKPVATTQTPVHGCLIALDSEIGETPVSYIKDVAPILLAKCAGCHSPGNIGPFALSRYDEVKSWSAMIEEVVLDRRMPPWDADPKYGHFVNDRSLTADESHTILQWIKQGCPKDDGEDPLTNVPPPAATWTLGEPDFLVQLPVQEIPATGTLDYRYIDAEFEMPEAGWLRAAVCRPGNPQVVHHMIVRVRYPAGYEDIPEEAYLFTTWAPGVPQAEFPSDTGVYLPKGAKFNFEMHYTTNGEEQLDQSEMGLYLARETPKMRLEVRASETRDLLIAPGDPDAQHTCFYAFKRDALIYDLSPHMHVRGSWFKFTALYPDGRRETLLSVPRYDFNWQSGHRFAEPLRVPAGTWIVCTGGFDNSPLNPHNPDPKKFVRWGLQTWDEMFMGFMTVADVADEAAKDEQPVAQGNSAASGAQ